MRPVSATASDLDPPGQYAFPSGWATNPKPARPGIRSRPGLPKTSGFFSSYHYYTRRVFGFVVECETQYKKEENQYLGNNNF